MPRNFLLSSLLSLLPVLAFSGAPYPSSLTRVTNTGLDAALAQTWSGIKARNITAYGDGLVHRPKSESPGDAVSESSAYGMILALYENDQATFNAIWDASEKILWNSAGGYYNWRWANGAVTADGSGMATDADEDICLMLLFADSLVKKQVWTAHTGPKSVDYKGRAKVMLNTLWSQAVTGKYNVSPGATWGGDNFVNPGYFAPANYRIFAVADPTHNWMAVVDQVYKVIQANPGYALGLLPDWVTPTGGWWTGSLGYNPFDLGHDMYKDGIRVLWRLGVDWTWNAEPRAKVFLDAAMKLIGSDPARANFYKMDGSVVSADSTFALCGGKGPTRPRREHSHLTVGMWSCAAMASTDPSVPAAWATELLTHRDGSTSDYWGWATDPNATDTIHAEDTAHNEMYFDQFLAWFGASVLAGRFSNLWEDLADPYPGVPEAWTVQPQVSAQELDFDKIRLTAGGQLSKPAVWRITITHRTTGQTWSASGTDAAPTADWGGQTSDGGRFSQGACDVVFSAHGLDDVSIPVWVAHQKDIRTADKNWLVVDDFAGATLSPNLGAWTTFDNSSKGGNAKVSSMAVTGTGSNRSLGFDYDLGDNGYQYCGVEWDANGWSGFPYVTKVSYRLKASHSVILDYYLVQSDITDETYFHVYDTVGTAWKTYTHNLSSFTPRQGTRSDKANPATGTAFRWHIQEDKQIGGVSSTNATGHFQIDSFHLGQVTAQMYTAPLQYLAMPPEVAIKASKQRSLAVIAIPQGLRITVPQASRAIVRDLSGRLLAQADVPAGSSDLVVPGRGLSIVQLTAPGWSVTKAMVRCAK